MTESVALVHDDPEFSARASAALRDAGYEVTTYSDSLDAINGIEAAQNVDVLVTRVVFPEGRPNGISLAMVLHTKFPALKVVFAAKREWELNTSGIGELVPRPVDLQELVGAVKRAERFPNPRPEA